MKKKRTGRLKFIESLRQVVSKAPMGIKCEAEVLLPLGLLAVLEMSPARHETKSPSAERQPPHLELKAKVDISISPSAHFPRTLFVYHPISSWCTVSIPQMCLSSHTLSSPCAVMYPPRTRPMGVNPN